MADYTVTVSDALDEVLQDYVDGLAATGITQTKAEAVTDHVLTWLRSLQGDFLRKQAAIIADRYAKLDDDSKAVIDDALAAEEAKR